MVNLEEISSGEISKKNLRLTPPDIWDFAMKLSEKFNLEI